MNLTKHRAAKAKLISQCIAILKISRDRIIKQGSGCVMPGVGAVYKYNGKRDAIGVLVESSQIYNHTYGEITGDEQKYLVNLIAKRFSVNIISEHNREYFKSFLQRLQDAHDDSFDEYNAEIEDRMSFFLNICDLMLVDLEYQLDNLKV